MLVTSIFPISHTVCSTLHIRNLNFTVTRILSSARSYNLDESKSLLSGNWLKEFEKDPEEQQVTCMFLKRKKVNFRLFTDDTINVTLRLYLKGSKTLYKKKKILVTSIFSSFPQCFQKHSLSGSLKLRIVW